MIYQHILLFYIPMHLNPTTILKQMGQELYQDHQYFIMYLVMHNRLIYLRLIYLHKFKIQNYYQILTLIDLFL